MTLAGYIDGVEGKLDSIDTRIANSVNTGATQYGETQNGRIGVTAYGRDSANGLMKALKLDASGRLECSVDALEVTAETINLSTDQLEAILGQTNTKLDGIDTAVDAGNALLTTLDVVQDNALTKLTEIDTAVDAGNAILTTIDEDTNAIKGHVDGIETLITATNSKIDALDSVADASLVKQTNLETLITQLDVVADASLVKETNIETLITAQSAKLPASLGQKADAASISTCRSSTQGAYDMTGRTTIGTASTTTNVLVDSAGHLQVDVLSGGGSTDVSALSTHAKQDTIIGHLDGVEGKLDHLSDNIDTLDAVQDNALTKLTNIESLITTADAVLDASLVKQTNLETLITALDTVQDNALTKLGEIETTADAILAKNTENETLLTSIAPRTATGTLSDAVNLVDGGATSIVDTDGYRYMTVFGKATNDFSLTVQYSLTNSASKMVSLYLQDFGTSSVNSINVVHQVLEHPARYVRFINYNGSQANALTLYYQLSN